MNWVDSVEVEEGDVVMEDLIGQWQVVLEQPGVRRLEKGDREKEERKDRPVADILHV